MERDIDYVIAVAQCKSISQAAEVLYISQPSLSRYLSNLESELGISLFIRTISGTELTEAGAVYVEYAKEIKRLRSTMNIKLRDLQKSTARMIRVGMTLNSISLSAFHVADKVKKKYPACHVELFNLLSKDISVMLENKKYDFVIGPDLDWPPEFVYKVLAREVFILAVPDRYHIEEYAVYKEGQAFPSVRLHQLPDLDYILQEETTAVRKGIDRICKRAGVRIVPKLLVTSSIIALQAAEKQMGCCIVAFGHLAFLNQREKLRFYQISEEDFSFAGVIYLRGKVLLEEERYCIACIKKALQEGEQQLLRRLHAI